MDVYVVRTCIQCGTNVYLGGTKRRWNEKPGIPQLLTKSPVVSILDSGGIKNCDMLALFTTGFDNWVKLQLNKRELTLNKVLSSPLVWYLKWLSVVFSALVPDEHCTAENPTSKHHVMFYTTNSLEHMGKQQLLIVSRMHVMWHIHYITVRTYH